MAEARGDAIRSRSDAMPSPSATDLAAAAAELARGALVAFPTETVYGLGADASNPQAVRRIFEVKGRPSSHPLIVHFADAGELDRYAQDVPDLARRLAEAFWPGPLTLVLPRSRQVPPIVTGGQATVALRVPAHPVALALLGAFGGGVAAPSANRFGKVSPTLAAHVREDLGADVDLVLDGGPCDVGVESTILDVSRGSAVLLRPGGLSIESIRERLDIEIRGPSADGPRVPGRLPAHYAPSAELVIAALPELSERVAAFLARGARVGVLSPVLDAARTGVTYREMPKDAAGFARQLYSGIRELDRASVDVIVVVPPEASGLGLAVADRLARAAAAKGGPK